MISNLIVFSTLILGALFTVLYLVRPEFRARVEQPKTTFIQQLSMYDKSIEDEQHAEHRNKSEQSGGDTKSVVRT